MFLVDGLRRPRHLGFGCQFQPVAQMRDASFVPNQLHGHKECDYFFRRYMACVHHDRASVFQLMSSRFDKFSHCAANRKLSFYPETTHGFRLHSLLEGP